MNLHHKEIKLKNQKSINHHAEIVTTFIVLVLIALIIILVSCRLDMVQDVERCKISEWITKTVKEIKCR